MYRIVQECRCGCGKKRAIKTENKQLAPKFHHAELTGSIAMRVTPEELTLEALAEPAVHEKLAGMIEDRVLTTELALSTLATRVESLERERALTIWQRVRRFLHV